ncbi:Eco57I restriction-modification methylase domain-containing protein [Actinoplanes sp. GCM10030250]|uniref:Eco57I restriction-modification methylase domain-containing protein n=1 Tax=Actinoplanes sp. GCM10030250 TaxID=3273376 RepID=UPI003623B3B2
MPSVTIDDFLGDVDAREIPWSRPAGAPHGLTPDRVLLADGHDALEVAVAVSNGRPKVEEVRRLWSLRWNRRAAPVVLVVAYRHADGWHATVCGIKDDPAVIADLDLSQVERICAAALAAADAVNAERLMARLLTGRKDQLVAGLTNSGLFASHELRTGVPMRADWANARVLGASLLRQRGVDLIRGLGYTITPHGSTAHVLAASGANRAIAVLLEDGEMFDRPSSRFGTVSPVALGLSIAAQQGLPWLLSTRGTQIRLYPTKPDVGVGRKGHAETFVELDLALLGEDQAAYLPLLCSADALTVGGSSEQILTASADHASGLGQRLRERVYVEVVPDLAKAVAAEMNATSEADLDEAYHRTLIILFRLLFVSYAEDRGLLPYQRNVRYTRRALKTLARELAENLDLVFDPSATDRWDDLLAVWRAVDDGNAEWSVPAYNGGLFAADDTHPSGRAIAGMRLSNADIGPALQALLIDTGDDGTRGPVDFRSLSVREFGTIYEGLLESSLSFATADLTLDRRTGAYVPAAAGSEVVVRAGEVYFHNASGARKSTGSYFTKAFAVEHLLDTALEPAISTHLAAVAELLAAGDDAAAAEKFFDFRAADLAMGSGHFLVAAIDRIESRFSAFLATYPISAITDELFRLAEVARTAVAESAAEVEIEPSSLLRRQIARRCVYGLDLNLIAVELARLAIWIHTFVPGLPMSSLDHNLVVGNSLTGIGTVDEVFDILEPQRQPGQVSIFSEGIEDALATARDRLTRVARTAEATKAEVREAARAHAKAQADAADAKALFDAAVAVRLGVIGLPNGPREAIDAARTEEAQNALAELAAVHLPYCFPEVFIRTRPGFDVVLGNPPWEKVRWEAAPFWVSVFPGLMAMADTARNAKIEELRVSHPMEAAQEQVQQQRRVVQQQLFRDAFTLRGGTHIELAQLMLERALGSMRRDGHLGVVLPRQCMVLAGWKKLRHQLVTAHDMRIVQGRNNQEWIFDDVHASYAVVLLSAGPVRERLTRVWVATSPEHVAAATNENAIALSADDLNTFSETHVIPWFATASDRDVFDYMRRGPRLASPEGWITGNHDARWDFRGSGPDRALAVRAEEPGSWRVLMTAHVDAFAFDPTEPYKQYVTDMNALVRKDRGVVVRDGEVVLGERHPMIIVRHPSRSDDSRTMIATALPERGLLHNKGYIHAVMHAEDTSEEARLALLGLLNTNAADWWVRRFADRHITAPVVNQIPLPDWSQQRVAEAAEITSVLLNLHGATILAGGVDVGQRARSASIHVRGLDDVELRARLERLALAGYGLTIDDLNQMLQDFNLKGTPDNFRRVALAQTEDQP